MSTIPRSPQDFFQIWLPSAFGPVAAKPSGSGQTSAPPNSPGALVFWIGDEAPFALRLSAGKLRVERALAPDCVVQVILSEADFEPVIVRGAEALMAQGNPEKQLSVLHALSLDKERVELIRGVPGSVAFVLPAGAVEHRIVLTPGVRPKALGPTECTVRCALNDFLGMQRGEANPFDLMMNGRLQISGDAQIPMALSSLLM
ncbi:MAG TPA: SCP2 sterol-binding domain-containing protein [Polyangiaceae bacterium]|nr:SCP2 sterol-binding domain-containing protein [Polyangiaceae bacterium]